MNTKRAMNRPSPRTAVVVLAAVALCAAMTAVKLFFDVGAVRAVAP